MVFVTFFSSDNGECLKLRAQHRKMTAELGNMNLENVNSSATCCIKAFCLYKINYLLNDEGRNFVRSITPAHIALSVNESFNPTSCCLIPLIASVKCNL